MLSSFAREQVLMNQSKYKTFKQEYQNILKICGFNKEVIDKKQLATVVIHLGFIPKDGPLKFIGDKAENSPKF